MQNKTNQIVNNTIENQNYVPKSNYIRMNYLEAHKIVHEYAGAVGHKTDEMALGFYLDDLLSISKEDVLKAYIIFLGHMFFWNTRSQEEYEAYIQNLRCLDLFIPSEEYSKIIENSKTLKYNGKLFKWKNNSIAKKKEENTILRYLECVQADKYMDKIDNFSNIALERVKEIKIILRNNKNSPDYSHIFDLEITKYVEFEYSYAMKSLFREIGNQVSGTGNHHLLSASLLAHVFV